MISRETYLEKASSRYHEQFLDRGNAASSAVNAGRRYLSEHGISERAEQLRIIRKYRLGVVISPLAGDQRFKGMLAIPYLTPFGVKAVKFRRLDGGKPKMAAPDNQPVRIYNTLAQFAAGPVIGLTEGEIDAIVATEMLGVPSMGIPGAENWIKYGKLWTPLFKNFRQVLVFKDGDPWQTRTRNGQEVPFKPGDELANAIAESLKLKAKIIECPVPEDVSSMVAAGRAEELRKQWAEDESDDEETTGDPYIDDPPPF